MANPHIEQCPDYQLPEFEESRLFFTVDGKSDEEAALILRNLWILSHAKAVDTWDREREAEVEANRVAKEQYEQEDERQRAQLEEEEKQAKLDERKKYKAKFAPIPDRPMPLTKLFLPSQHTLTKIRKGEYVPLYHFTNRGIREMEEDTTDNNDLLTLVQTDDGPTFQTAASAKAKKHTVKDEHLSWEEFSQANYRMLNAMQQQDWPEERISMLRDFWVALETHDWRHDISEHRKRALLHYQGQVRKDWHKMLGTPLSFRLLPLRAERLHEYHQVLLASAFTAQIDAAAASNARASHPYNNASQHRPTHARSTSMSKRPLSPTYRDQADTYAKRQRPFRAEPQSANSSSASTPAVLPVCAVCLGRDKHSMPVIQCPATRTWDDKFDTLCECFNKALRIRDGGQILCSLWQCECSCHEKHDQMHACSGCGALSHGASKCPRAQKAPAANSL